MVFRF